MLFGLHTARGKIFVKWDYCQEMLDLSWPVSDINHIA